MVAFLRRNEFGQVPMKLSEAGAWLEGHLAKFKDGGRWMIPRARSVYRVERERRAMVREEGPGDPATEKVLAHIGWKLETKENGNG